jgi:hypothetical protein
MASAHPGEGDSNVSARAAERGVSAAANIAAGAVVETNLIAFSECSLDQITESVGDRKRRASLDLYDAGTSAGFSGENHKSTERSLSVATLLNPLSDGISCGVSGMVPSVMLYAVTAQTRSRRIGRQMQLVGVRPVEEITIPIPGRERIFGAGVNGTHNHGGRRRIGDLEAGCPLVHVQIALLQPFGRGAGPSIAASIVICAVPQIAAQPISRLPG